MTFELQPKFKILFVDKNVVLIKVLGLDMNHPLAEYQLLSMDDINLTQLDPLPGHLIGRVKNIETMCETLFKSSLKEFLEVLEEFKNDPRRTSESGKIRE